jgi:hypothetical protein
MKGRISTMVRYRNGGGRKAYGKQANALPGNPGQGVIPYST